MTVNDDLIDRVLDGEASEKDSTELSEWLGAPGNLERQRPENQDGYRNGPASPGPYSKNQLVSRESIHCLISVFMRRYTPCAPCGA